jgi:hypothetical protein
MLPVAPYWRSPGHNLRIVPVYSQKGTSRSICAPTPSHARRGQWSHSNLATPSYSIHKPAAHALCAPNARKLPAEKAELFRLSWTKTARRSFASSSKPSQVVHSYASEPRSNTGSLTSQPARVTALGIGVRRNLFDLRRAAAIQNLEGIHFILRHAA